PLPGMAGRRFLDGRIDARVSPKIERIMVSRQFKITPGLIIIGQSKIASSHAKLQIGKLRINLGGFLVKSERLPIGARSLQINALLVNLVPCGFLIFIQANRMYRSERSTIL